MRRYNWGKLFSGEAWVLTRGEDWPKDMAARDFSVRIRSQAAKKKISVRVEIRGDHIFVQRVGSSRWVPDKGFTSEKIALRKKLNHWLRHYEDDEAAPRKEMIQAILKNPRGDLSPKRETTQPSSHGNTP